MENLRKYGHRPFRVAVIHGGPGAAGEMAPVARDLSSSVGVLEPMQTANTIRGQLQELREILEKEGNPPLTLVGFSWGAWLAYVLATRYPLITGKLILVASGPFEEKYAGGIMATRLGRLSENERNEALKLLAAVNSGTLNDNHFVRFGELMNQADVFDPLPGGAGAMAFDPSIYQSVWEEASELRKSGELLRLGKKIKCPVVAIHGGYDPHPSEGVREPLSRVIKDFRFILLPECGHRPWVERKARDAFYRTLKTEIGFQSQ